MEVAFGGRTHTFKDCKVWTDGAAAWDWNATGTHHVPGTQPADIAELLERGIEELVLSRGLQLALQTSPETEDLLRALEIPYHIEETGQAVALFNRLWLEGRRVGGMFHSTC
jgi:hypothetical protein